jgi:hypothetical protein
MKTEKPTKKSRITIHPHGAIRVYGGRDGTHIRACYSVPSSRYSTFVSYVSGAPGTKKDFVISFRPLLCSDARFEIHNVRTTDINTKEYIEVYGYLFINSEWL